jgi:bacteriorhodopsin
VSSALNRAPDAAPGKTVAAETVEKTSSKWWWIPVGVAVAALLAGVMRMLTRRKPEPVKVAANPAPTTRGRVIDERDKRND